MKISIIEGTDSKLYSLIGPFAMNNKVIREFDGYPILTSPEHVWFVAIERKDVVAFSSIKRFSDHCEFTNDYVIPDYRTKGIHKKLLEVRMKWCKDNGFSTLRADCMAPSLKAYTNAGFEIKKSFVKWHKLEKVL